MDVFIEEKPVIIKEGTLKLFGIIREAAQTNQVAILSPWVMGDRTGVTRIYVEAAREMQKNYISSLCIDMPQVNYSYDSQFSNEYYVKCYSVYLEKALQFMKEIFPGKEMIIIGFCSSGIPAIYVSRKYNLKKVITLNPFHFPLRKEITYNTEYFPSGYLKKPVHESFSDYVNYYVNKLNMLHILSEKESDVMLKRDYIQKYFEDDNCNVKVEYIQGTDHTFDGWYKKREVIRKIIDWIQE
jgi:hypothetical protein